MNEYKLDETFADYRAAQGINASSIKSGRVSMRHMHYAMTRESSEPTPAMKYGTLVHLAVLEPLRYTQNIVVWDGGIKAGKAWKEFNSQQEAHCKTIVTVAEAMSCSKISAAVWANKEAAELLTGAACELSLFWDDPEAGKCKARIDAISDDRLTFIDIKTTSKFNDRGFSRDFVNMGYDIQFGWYSHGIKTVFELAKMPSCAVIYIESCEPFDVCVRWVPASVVKKGYEEAERIAVEYHNSAILDSFPGVSEQTGQELVLPEWYMEGAEVSLDDVEPMDASEL